MAQRCSFCGEDRRGVDRLVAGSQGVAICGDCARLVVEVSSEPDHHEHGDLVLTGIGTLVTNDPRHGGGLGIIEGATVAVRQGRITWLGRHRSLPDRYRALPELDCDGRMVAPALIDAHRHLPTDPTADLASLTDRVSFELGRLLEEGATTVEFRSYGATEASDDVTALAAMASAADILPVDVVPTVVAGAKGVWRSNGYIRMLEAVLVPALSGIARYLDFVLDGLGTTDAVRLAALGRTRGLRPRVHVDRVEALEAAFDCRAVSVDGMWGLEEAAESVAESDMVMVSVPAASWLQGRPDPARQMWDAGTVVALGTGCEGGSVPTVPMAMAVAVHHGGLTPEESLWSATRGGALAIEDPERGMVRPGCVADLVLLEAETAADLVDEPGKDPVVRVIKDGSPL